MLLFYTCSPVTEVETTIKFLKPLPLTIEVKSPSVTFCFLKNYTISDNYFQEIKDVCVCLCMKEVEQMEKNSSLIGSLGEKVSENNTPSTLSGE